MNVSLFNSQPCFVRDTSTTLVGGTKVCQFGFYCYNYQAFPAVLLQKRVTTDPKVNKQINRFFANEVAILRMLNTDYPTCTHFCYMIYADDESMVVERYSPDLIDAIDKGINPLTNLKFTHLDRLEFALDTVEAVQFLHNIGFVHKDLKPDNLFIDRRLRKVRIGDFGYTAFRTDDFARALVGTIEYSSPEILFAKGYNQSRLPDTALVEALDLWSLGQTLNMLFYSKLPSVFIEEKGEYIPPLTRFRNVTNYCKRNPSYNIYGLLDLNPNQRTPLDRLTGLINESIATEYLNLVLKS